MIEFSVKYIEKQSTLAKNAAQQSVLRTEVKNMLKSRFLQENQQFVITFFIDLRSPV